MVCSQGVDVMVDVCQDMENIAEVMRLLNEKNEAATAVAYHQLSTMLKEKRALLSQFESEMFIEEAV